MPNRLITRSLHAITLSAVAGAAVLAPTAAVAADASSEDDVDNAESSATLTPADEESNQPAEEKEDDSTGAEDQTDETESDELEGSEQDDAESSGDVDEDAEPAEKEGAALLAGEDDEAAEEEEIDPDVGLGKYNQPIRVGVDLAEGTYVPDGVTTAGSTLLITETGPDVEGGSTTAECTTEASTAVGTATFCLFPDEVPEDGPPDLDGPSGIGPLSITYPENPNIEQDPQVYLAQRTSTVTVTQIGTAEGLVADPEPAVVAPCGPPSSTIFIGPFEVPAPGTECTRQVALMEDTGLPPLATDDAATTEQGSPVDIDVLANDDSVAGAPITDVDLASAPRDGAARVVGNGADAVVEYTPADGFAGTDTFRYGYTTPNGAAFATVTVEVEAVEKVAAVARVVPSGSMPDAGGPDRSLLGWAVALIVAGAGALTLGRRRVVRTD